MSNHRTMPDPEVRMDKVDAWILIGVLTVGAVTLVLACVGAVTVVGWVW